MTVGIDLSKFAGLTLERVSIGLHQIAFDFDPGCSIASESGYVLRFVDDSEQYESFHVQPEDVHV
ncbi:MULTISPECIES: hypothetical protein [unclassified Mycobacterium]|uniref:hypothetical protein n=1 Tax=unclassified Mycobacterium TaxID=2642494 RepID=UPI0029C6DC9F|nr:MULTISPECIES: hypothetical protein [unclassified Mycobacterium]